jgi:putative FmdB family regulatory protein
MPIYAYRCADCGHAQDVLQKLSDPVLTVCPSCGAEAYQKQLTAAGFQLKGSGWYVTDFRGGNTGAPKKDGEAPDTPAADAKAGEGGKPEATSTDKKDADKKPADKKAVDTTAPAAPAKAAPASSAPPASPAAPSGSVS